MRAFWKWSLRIITSVALVVSVAIAYFYWSYIEWIKEQPIPFAVDYKSGDVQFKLPWQWGTEEYGEIKGMCRNPNSRDM